MTKTELVPRPVGALGNLVLALGISLCLAAMMFLATYIHTVVSALFYLLYLLELCFIFPTLTRHPNFKTYRTNTWLKEHEVTPF